jgi:cytochrome P450
MTVTDPMVEIPPGVSLVEPLEANLFRREFHRNPRPIYHLLRRTDPMLWSDLVPGGGGWIVTGYAEATQILRDRRFGKNAGWGPVAESRGLNETVTLAVVRRWLSQLDTPDHTRLRSLFAKPFAPSSVAAFRPRIQEIVDGLLDEVEEAGECNIVPVLNFGLPATVICEILGIPLEDKTLMRDWSSDMFQLFEYFMDPAEVERCDVGMQKMVDYTEALVAEKRRNPGSGDLIDEVLHAQAEGAKISDEEIVANVLLMFIAAYKTTADTTGHALYNLLINPGQLELVRASDDALAAAVDESLRYEAAINNVNRVAHEDVEVCGKQVKAGQMIVIMHNAVNTDPAVNPNPDTFDIRRDKIVHHQFGGGIHRCLGMHLAKAELEIALGTCIRRFPGIEMTAEPVWDSRMFLRGLECLQVRVR